MQDLSKGQDFTVQACHRIINSSISAKVIIKCLRSAQGFSTKPNNSHNISSNKTLPAIIMAEVAVATKEAIVNNKRQGEERHAAVGTVVLDLGLEEAWPKAVAQVVSSPKFKISYSKIISNNQRPHLEADWEAAKLTISIHKEDRAPI